MTTYYTWILGYNTRYLRKDTSLFKLILSNTSKINLAKYVEILEKSRQDASYKSRKESKNFKLWTLYHCLKIILIILKKTFLNVFFFLLVVCSTLLTCLPLLSLLPLLPLYPLSSPWFPQPRLKVQVSLLSLLPLIFAQEFH